MSCDRCFSGLSLGAYDQNNNLKEFPHPENDGRLGIASRAANYSSPERLVAETLADSNSHNKLEKVINQDASDLMQEGLYIP